MALQFNQIPGNIRVPFVRFEVNAGRQPFQSTQRLVLMGQKTSAGVAPADTPVLVSGGEDGLFGAGSMLAAMYKIARANAPFQEIWAIPLADAGGATKAQGQLAISAATPISFPGSVVLYIGGQRVTVPVNNVIDSATIASSIANAINACPGIQVLAAVTAGAKATATITFTGGPLGSADTMDFTLNGTRFSVPVLSGDSNAQLATKVAAAINLQSATVKVNASVVGAVITLTAQSNGAFANAYTLTTGASGDSAAFGTATTRVSFAMSASGINDRVTLTANNAGTLGNSIRIETKMYPDDGELADTLLTITQLTGGAGDPSISTAIANMGDDQWDWIVMPYCQHALLNEIEAWLDARWGPMSQMYGHCISAMNGSHGAVQAFTSTRNSWHTSIMPSYRAPHPTYLWAAAVGARAAEHLQEAPELSRPLQTIELIGILPPKLVADQWSTVQRQSMYYAGASGYRVQSGEVQIDRLITTYQKNQWGQPDQSWLDINTIAQLVYGLRSMMAYMTQTYPRAALVDANPNNIQGFATAEDIRLSFIHAYQGLEAIGVFENSALFKQLLIVERNATDPNRVDTYLPLDHVNQLRVLAVNATSYLQFNTIA